MPLSYDSLLAHPFPEIEQRYTERDAMLYALAVGFGREQATAPTELPYVFERDLKVAPTFAAALGVVSIRDAGLGVNYARVVHGDQALVFHAPLPTAGTVKSRTRVAEAVDRGPGKGAILFIERTLTDAGSGTRLATSTMGVFCRDDGGFGGPVTQAPAPHALPERAPDVLLPLAPPANAALLYRLTGDMNPLHADPAVARAAGFERPILHGLQIYGELGRLMLQHFGGEAGRLTQLACRFTGVVLPGDRLAVECWRDGDRIGFRVRPEAGGRAVVDNGLAVIESQLAQQAD